MNWLAFAAGISVALYGLFIAAAWPNVARAGFLASLPHFAIAALNGAAPVRALADPAYLGWSFGLISTQQGWRVTLMAGGIFVVAMFCAWLALSARRGAILYVMAAFDAFILVVLGWPLARAAAVAPESFKLQAGEYFTIPSYAGIAAVAVIIVIPLVLTMIWALRRAGGNARLPEAT